MTVPEAAARIGAPYAAPRSMPSCMRPQRQPNGLVIGAETGQTIPDDDDVTALDALPLLEVLLAAAFAWAARICAPSCALDSLSASISEASACSFADRLDS